jgi:hypothetical protein
MLKTMDGRMEWVEGRERRAESAMSPEAVAMVLGIVLLVALVL